MSGGSGGEKSMETPRLEETVAKVKAQLSAGEMPSTAQLMAAIRANPFEAKFAEANRRMSKSSEGEGATASASASASASTPSADDSQDSATSSKEGRKLARKTSAGSGLSLKLPPPTLTSQSPGLFSNVSMLEEPEVGAMGTPEIARLVRQVQEPKNSRVPGTAEVLESVLTINSESKPSSSPPSIAQSTATSGTGSTLLGVPAQECLDGGGDEPPSIPPLGGEVVGGGADGYFLQLRVGSQTMRIPMDVAVGGKDEASGGGGQQPEIPSLETGLSRSNGALSLAVDEAQGLSRSWNAGQRLLPAPANDLGLSANSSRGVSPANPRIPQVKTELYSSSPPARSSAQSLKVAKPNYSGAASDGGSEADDKRKDTLERNKAAAIRYRKRKKEELVMLQEKVRKVEEEKFELQTQVTVLKRELERSVKKLDIHRGCNCPCEAKAKLEGSLESLSAASAMPYILQPVLAHPSQAAAAASHQQAAHQLLNFVLPPKVSPLQHSPHQHSPHMPSSQP